jgi:hypothetical protein
MTIAQTVTVSSGFAARAGFQLPVVLTRAAWDEAVTWTAEDTRETGVPQDEAGRLWDVLWMASRTLKPASRIPEGSAIEKSFSVMRIPRGMPYEGDSDDDATVEAYQWQMTVDLMVVVGGTPTTVTISLRDEE